MNKYLPFIKKNIPEIIIILFSLSFSSWLMFSTFSYNNNTMLIASKAWSDFASHIPLIRSFSYGSNFPPEYPLFPGEPIRYHFLFYAIVGLLERIGFRIDFALNIPSILSFSGLLIMIYFFAKKIFQSKVVGILSILFFIFNGSLSFLEFFKTHPFSANTYIDIIKNTSFPSFGPYDGKIVSAFWNLNIYTNQRHLALSFLIILVIIYLLYPKLSYKSNTITIIIVTLLLNFLLFTNQAALVIASIWILWIIFINFPKKLFFLITFFIIPLWFFIFPGFINSAYNISFKFGFLSQAQNFFTFINYWFFNLGLYIILIPLGILKSKHYAKKLFGPMLILFILPNIFQFSPDIINNHKFLNFFLIIGAMYVANFIYNTWKKDKFHRLHFYKLYCVILFIFLTLSGVIDFMPIKNDFKIPLTDIPDNKDALFIKEHIPSKDVILNSNFLYDPSSIAGRKIYYGYSYFAWSYGYNTNNREKTFFRIFRTKTKNSACLLFKENNISYIELNNNPSPPISFDSDFWQKNFKKIYTNPINGTTIYDVKQSCQ